MLSTHLNYRHVFKVFTVSAVLITGIFLSKISFAQDLQEKTVEFQGTLRVDNDFNPNETGAIRYNLHTQRFELQASVKLPKLVPESFAKEILLVVRTQMNQDIYVNGILNANHLTPADYLKEAYIEFKRVGGLPVAVIVGTTEVSYGQDYPGTMDFQNDAFHAISDPDRGQIKAFTVALDKSVLPLFDKIEATYFAPNPSIKSGLHHFDGFSFRVTRNLTESLTTEVSVLRRGNAYDPALQAETSLSFGGVYQKGIWTLWGEGIHLNHSEAYPDAALAGTVGVSRLTGPGQINGEATAIKNVLRQYALGYELFVNRSWAVGTTFRYTFCVGGNPGCVSARGFGQGPSLGVSVRYAFGGDYKNPTWLGNQARQLVRKISFGHLGTSRR